MPAFTRVTLFTDRDGRARFRDEAVELPEGTPQAMLSEMAIRYHATRLLVHKAAWALDKGVRDPLTSSLAKAYGADAAMASAIDAVQVFGGNGYVKEYPVEKLMRDAKILQIYEGTAQIQRIVIAKQLLA